MEIENEFMMSQAGYASIDFTLLDRPNNNIASAPEATAVLLPDELATDSSFPSFDLLDGSGVVGSYGYAGQGDDSQALEQSRGGSEKEFYKEQAMHSNTDNGVGGSNVEYGEYQMSQSVPKPVCKLDFFAKHQAPQPQVQQLQLNLFGSDGGEENQEFFESSQASQQSQATGSSWWMPDSSWAETNNQRGQSQVYNWAAMNEEQRRSIRLRMEVPQSESEHPGAMYSMPLVVNSDPTPPMYSFLPANTHQLHKTPLQADAASVQALQSSSAGKDPQYDFPGLLNGSGYQQGGNLAPNMSLMQEQRYRAMVQGANVRNQQIQMQEVRNREQQLRMKEASSREQQQIKEHHLREHQARVQQLREQQLRLQEARSRENKLRMQEASSGEQQLRLYGQQNQSFSKYDNQNVEVSLLKVSDYDSLGGGNYTMKVLGHSEVRQHLNEGEDRLWRPQQSQLAAPQQPRQLNACGNSSYEDMHQRQQAQVRRRLQHQAQQQQLLGGNQSQASGNQLQGFLGEGLLQDLPQVMEKQSELVNLSQTSANGHNVFVPPNVLAVNQNSGGSMMFNPQNEGGAGQGSINYLLGQDNSFSWHQLAMKASGLDQPNMHASAANSGKAGSQLNLYANEQGGAMPGSLGVMGKHPSPAGQINRPIARSLRAGPLPLLGMDSRAGGQDHQASKARMLFGQAMQQQQEQQQPPSQAAKDMQGFPCRSQQGNYMADSRQALEEAHRRHGLNLRGNAIQQDGVPHVKLFAQSLTSMDPIQQQHQQHLMAASRNAQNLQSRHTSILQQSAPNMAQERYNQLGASPGQQYHQGVNQAGVSLHNAADRNQQPTWNNYEMEADAAEVEVPVMVLGNRCSLLKSNSWSGGSQAYPVPESDNPLIFERPRTQQQNVWGLHGVQPSNSQSSSDIGSGQHNTQSGSVVQQGTPKSTGGHPLGSQVNGGLMHQSPLQSGAPMLDPSEMEAHRRQQELQNSQEETNWRKDSLLQASPRQATDSNAALQTITEADRAQTSWKSLWQSLQNPENSGQKEPQNTLWGQNRSHVSGPQPELYDGSKARIALNGWDGAQGALQADLGGESHQGTRLEQQVMVSGSPQAAQGFQDVEGRQQMGNQGPAFQEALRQTTLSDNDPSSMSQYVDQCRQNATSFAQPDDRDGSDVKSSDLGGHSSSSKEVKHYSHYSTEQQTSVNKGNLENQGKMNAWTAETRQGFDDTSVSAVDNCGQQDGRVQLQLSNQRAENRFSSLMSATGNMAEEFPGAQPVRSLNTVSGYGHPSKNGRPSMLNGHEEGSMGGWAHGQMSANQMQIQQSILAGRALQTNNVVGNAEKEAFLPTRPESAGDEQSSYTNSMLAQRARYSGRRDVADPGRNTLELLHQSEQGEEIGDALVDQEGLVAEDGAGPSATSLAHLRLGHMGGSLLQRPSPSRADFALKEQGLRVVPQGARNVESWPQGRNLQQEITREDGRVYIQTQMQSQMQAQTQVHIMRGAQSQGENMARPDLMHERVGTNLAFVGANRHFSSDMSRQAAANIYKSLSEAANIQFRNQLRQQQLANQQRAQENHRASVGGHPMDLVNMSGAMDPRTVAQQHMLRAGYPERPAMAASMSFDKQFAGSEMGVCPPGQGDVGLPQAQPGALQLSQQPAPDVLIVKKRKEFPPLVPWRTTISQGSTNLPTTSRSEMEWACATNSNSDQERFNNAVETLDVTAMCVKRAKRRLKFTTQLMQQLVPALPCQLFKGTGLDDYKSATFVLAKFAVSEACWLSTGLSRGGSGAVAVEDTAEMSNGDDSTVKSDQQVAGVKQGSPATFSSKLRTQLHQKMTELQDELSRLENAATASALSKELHDLDKMVVLNRMARVHGSEFLGGLRNPSESPRWKLESHGEAPVVYSPENAYPERFVAAVFVPQTIPKDLMLFPL